MKHYKIFLIEQGRSKTVTEKALSLMEDSHLYTGKYKVMGECDQSGNLIEDIAGQNFTNFKEEKKEVKVQKPTLKTGDDEDPVSNLDKEPTKEQLDRRKRNNDLHKQSLKNKSDEKQRPEQ